MHEHTLTFLAINLVIGLNLGFTSGFTWEDIKTSSAVWARKEFRLKRDDDRPKLFRRQLTSATTVASDATADSTSGGWIAQCDHLSDDLVKTWNLTTVVAEKNWPVVEDVAETLYTMLLTCTEGHVWTEADCLIKNLVVLKNILVPAVKMNLVYIKEAFHLIPDFVNSSKECFTFGS